MASLDGTDAIAIAVVIDTKHVVDDRVFITKAVAVAFIPFQTTFVVNAASGSGPTVIRATGPKT